MIKRDLRLFPTTQRLLFEIDGIMAGANDSATLIPDMMTIGAFEEKLLAEFIPDRNPIDQIAESLLLSEILRKRYIRSGGGPFKRVWRFPGFQKSLQSLFSEFGSGLVDASTLSKIIGYAPAKEGEISSIYSGFKSEVAARGYTDTGTDRLDLLTALEKKSIVLSSFLGSFGSITLNDIYQFTPYRFELFKKLSTIIPVNIIAPLPDDRKNAFGYVVTNLAKFESLAENSGQLDIKFEETSSGPLAPLANKIFQIGESLDFEESGLPPVTILSCNSRYREIEEVCADIIGQRKSGALQWSDFCLVFRDLRPYGAIVEDVFNRYQAPFMLKKATSLAQNPLIRVCMSLLNLAEGGYSRADVIEIVTSSYFQRFGNLDRDDVWQLYLAAGIIDGSPKLWEGRLKAAVVKRSGESRKSGQRIICATIGLLERVERLSNQDRAKRFFDTYSGLLNWLKLSPEQSAGVEQDEKIRFRDYRAYARLFEALGDFHRAGSDLKLGLTPIGFHKIKDLLYHTVESQPSAEMTSSDTNKVFITNAHDMVGLSYKHVYVCGLHEGEFPGMIFQHLVLTEEERKEFNKKHLQVIGADDKNRRGRRVFDSDTDKWQEESLLFFQAIRAAEESITFSYSFAELGGQPLMKSMFLNNVIEALVSNAHTAGASRELIDNIIKTPMPLTVQKPMGELLDSEERQSKILYDLFRDNDGERERLLADLSIMFSGAPRLRRFRDLLGLAVTERSRDMFFSAGEDEKDGFSSPWLGAINKSTDVLMGYIENERKYRYSPTALERYGQCPFRYFASGPLGLKEIEEPEIEVDARTSGTLAHSIAEEFYRRKIKQGGLPLTGGENEWIELNEVAEAEFAKYAKRGELGDKALWEVESERTMAFLRRWLHSEVEDQQKNGYKPIAVELSCDIEGVCNPDTPPLKIKLPSDGERLLIGRIDRIDVVDDGSGARVIDYKLGANRALYAKKVKMEILGKESFQPAVYSLMAREYLVSHGLMKPEGKIKTGYRLFNEKDAKKAYVVADLSPPGWGGDKGDFIAFAGDGNPAPDSFESLVCEMMRSIESGQFPVTPTTCDYCEFAGLCRYIATSK